MILQALKEYYDRKAADPDSSIAPYGFEWKEIAYILVLRPDGTPVSIESTIELEGKKKRAKRFLVPSAVKKTSATKANLLWENAEYALGIPIKGNPKKAGERHAAFIAEAESLMVDDAGMASLLTFLGSPNKEERLSALPAWEELASSTRNVSFRLAGEKGLLLERPAVREAIERRLQATASSSEEAKSVCLVSGERSSIEILHPAIKGVRGSQSSGANIVSFNHRAFRSFGKDQGANAPVGKRAAFAYTTALNHLLRESQQRLQVGDATTVFWSEKSCDLETGFVDIFGMPSKDDPERGVGAVRNLYRAIETGAYVGDEEQNRFYVLGLSPNAARISVRFWIVDTVAGMARKIEQYFEDLKIAHGPRESDYLPLFPLLVSTAVQGKADNINPRLSGEIMRAALQNLPFPNMLLQSLLGRIRAEHKITYCRAALIKAYINRRSRFENASIQEELKVSLDPSNTNIGYRLGRLFATLEKIQTEVHPGPNATIRDRFYGAASGAPVTVFSNLMRLKNHHLAKLEHPGRKTYFEKLIAEIMDEVDDFPGHLSLADQGRFAVGYYHQMQKFYTKKPAGAAEATGVTEGEDTNE